MRNRRSEWGGGFLLALVSRGVYRLLDNQSGEILFQLFGNGWRFRRGHVARLELVGRELACLVAQLA